MFDPKRAFEYENGFYHTSDKARLAKLLAHYELYRRVAELPGAIVECGVFRGASLIRLATFRDLVENSDSRKVLAFDTFAGFPEAGYRDDEKYREAFTNAAGETSSSVEELEEVFRRKGITNHEFIAGDILETVPAYAMANPHLKIALLNIDTDLYEPARVILEHFYDRVVRGGLILLDDYGTFPGETAAVDEFIARRELKIEKLPLYHIPSFIVKP